MANTTTRKKAATAALEMQLELAPFANNPYKTAYSQMLHREYELDRKEKSLKRKQCFANWMLFASIVLVIGCVIGTYFVCTTIQSIRIG